MMNHIISSQVNLTVDLNHAITTTIGGSPTAQDAIQTLPILVRDSIVRLVDREEEVQPQGQVASLGEVAGDSCSLSGTTLVITKSSQT